MTKAFVTTHDWNKNYSQTNNERNRYMVIVRTQVKKSIGDRRSEWKITKRIYVQTSRLYINYA